jgi:hypothetical protein
VVTSGPIVTPVLGRTGAPVGMFLITVSRTGFGGDRAVPKVGRVEMVIWVNRAAPSPVEEGAGEAVGRGARQGGATDLPSSRPGRSASNVAPAAGRELPRSHCDS